LAAKIGYAVRPYDMLADARRWRWQKPQRCGWFETPPPEVTAALQDFMRLFGKWRTEPHCELPPEGWWCSAEPGHDGPCPARRLPRNWVSS
jgi:hypothetical protein